MTDWDKQGWNEYQGLVCPFCGTLGHRNPCAPEKIQATVNWAKAHPDRHSQEMYVSGPMPSGRIPVRQLLENDSLVLCLATIYVALHAPESATLIGRTAIILPDHLSPAAWISHDLPLSGDQRNAVVFCDDRDTAIRRLEMLGMSPAMTGAALIAAAPVPVPCAAVE